MNGSSRVSLLPPHSLNNAPHDADNSQYPQDAIAKASNHNFGISKFIETLKNLESNNKMSYEKIEKQCFKYNIPLRGYKVEEINHKIIEDTAIFSTYDVDIIIVKGNQVFTICEKDYKPDELSDAVYIIVPPKGKFYSSQILGKKEIKLSVNKNYNKKNSFKDNMVISHEELSKIFKSYTHPSQPYLILYNKKNELRPLKDLPNRAVP